MKVPGKRISGRALSRVPSDEGVKDVPGTPRCGDQARGRQQVKGRSGSPGKETGASSPNRVRSRAHVESRGWENRRGGWNGGAELIH